MALAPELVPTAFSLAAVFAWGASDFSGGYASRRGNAFLVTTIAHASGLIFMCTLAFATHAPFLSGRSLAWAVVAGTSGGTALAIFYRALAVGRMGLTAPVAALLGAAIPTAFGMLTEGFPGTIRISGFLLAGIGIWLISRTEDGSGSEGIGLAALAGLGFAGFYLGMREAGDGSALWLATITRTGGLLVTGLIVILTTELFARSLRLACAGESSPVVSTLRVPRSLFGPVRPGVWMLRSY